MSKRLRHGLQERKGKKEYLYSVIYYACIVSKCSDIDHAVLAANTPCLSFLRKRSTDGATPNRGGRHLVAASYYLSIDTEGMNG